MEVHALFGIMAGVIALAAFPVYIHDVVRGKTRPNRATWLILTLSGFILAASYYASGARDTLWISLAYPLGFLAIAILSFKYGEKKWYRFDTVCLVLAVASAALWWFLQTPLVTLFINVGIDFLGILPTIYKTYRKPSTESRSAWILDVIASVFALLAVAQWTFSIAFYPVYLLITNCIIVILILRKKHSWRLNR